MKKLRNTFIIFTFLLFMLFGYAEVKADSYFDNLSFSCKKNLVDQNNLIYDNTNHKLSTDKDIFITKHESKFYIQISDEYFNSSPVFKTRFYDIDGIFIFEDTSSATKEDELGTYYISVSNSYIELAAAFSFEITGFSSDPTGNQNTYIMAYTGEELTECVLEYESTDKIYNISEGYHPTLVVSYDTPLSEADVEGLFIFYDGSTAASNLETYVDTSAYLNNQSTIGKYKVYVNAEDSYVNRTEGYAYIEVIDPIPPVISGPSEVRIPVFETVTEETILSKFLVSDAYDKNDVDFYIKNETYSLNSSSVRQESLVLEAVDNSGNKTTKPVVLSFYDSVPPYAKTTLETVVSYRVSLSIDDIINLLEVTDNVDPSPNISVIGDTYSSKENRVGTYYIDFLLTDASGNRNTCRFAVKVVDDIPPVILFDAYLVMTNPNVTLEQEDFDELLLKSGVLSSERKYKVTVLNDTYSRNKSTPGKYAYDVEYLDENDQKIVQRFQVIVEDNSYVINPIETERKTNAFPIILISSLSVLSIGMIAVMIIYRKKHI